VDHDEYGALRAECIEVHFPPDPEFRVFADGQVLDFLPPEPWFERVVAEARGWVLAHGPQPPGPDDARRILDRIGEDGIHPPDFSAPIASMGKDERRLVAFYVSLVELCLWVAAIVNEEGRFAPNEFVVDEIAKYNHEFLLQLVNFMDVMGPRAPDSMTEAFRKSIRRYGQVTGQELAEAIGRIDSVIGLLLMRLKSRRARDPRT
jgi:hypothetical protein